MGETILSLYYTINIILQRKKHFNRKWETK